MSPAPPAQRDKSSAPFGANKQSLPASGHKCTHETMERDRIGLWGSGDGQSASLLSGLDRLKHPGLNKVCTLSFIEEHVVRLGHMVARPSAEVKIQCSIYRVMFAMFRGLKLKVAIVMHSMQMFMF